METCRRWEVGECHDCRPILKPTPLPDLKNPDLYSFRKVVRRQWGEHIDFASPIDVSVAGWA
jgi:hypothetical protein